VIPSASIDPVALAVDGAAVDTLIDWARNQLREDGFLIYSTAATAPVQRAHGRPGRTDVANLIEQAFSRIARALADAGVRTFVVAGGETAGAIVQALGIGVITFGEEIDPGVPWTYSLDPPGYSFALKSGNFGRPDFFLKAMGAVHERSTLS
jgi:uncharacterized protein YgbK (DUF1537 family)